MASHNPRQSIGVAHRRSPWWRLTLGIAPLLTLWLVGCATSATSIFNHAAPVPAESVVALSYGTATEGGVMGVRGTDGVTLWHAAIGNINWAPVRVSGMLFAVVRQANAPDQQVAAVRLSDGKALWTAPIAQADQSYNDYLAADATIVVAAAGPDGLAAYDSLTGQPRWQVPMGVSGKPFVRGGVVYALLYTADSSALTALRGTDGAVLWRVPAAGGSGGIGMAANSTTLFAPLGNGAVMAIRLSDGHVLWYGPRMRNPGKVLATADDMGDVVLGATDDIVLATDGALLGVDARTGTQLWRTLPHGEQTSSDLTLALNTVPSAGGIAYVETEHGLSAIRLRDGGEVWHVSLSGASLVISDTMYVYREELAYCHEDCAAKLAAFDAATGQLFWQLSPANTSLLAQPEPGEAA